MDYKDMGWLPAENGDDEVSLRLEEAQRLAQDLSGETKTVESTLTGDIRFHRDVPSKFLKRARDIAVYLPPDYEEHSDVRYPVLYLQDGQNLFDAATAYVPGHDWKADETAEELIRAGEITPMIIVAIYHAGEHRLEEYTPSKDEGHPGAGKARLYGRFMTEELKPLIDRVYRTLPGPTHTAIGGSSLGALVSIFTGLNYSDVFGNVLALSPSVWWNKQGAAARVRRLRKKRVLRIWLDMGTDEGAVALESVRRFRDALLAKGWVDGGNLHYLEIEGAQHSEDAWAARFGDVLCWLFPQKP